MILPHLRSEMWGTHFSGAGAEVEEIEERAGGFFGVADLEVVVEPEGKGPGGERGEGLEVGFGRALGGAGTDEDALRPGFGRGGHSL